MKSLSFLAFSLLYATLPVAAEDAAVRELAGGKKEEIRHSMVGPRDTILFYTYEAGKAVLRVQIAGKGEAFQVTGAVLLFDPAADAEGIAKWINNQHSDGLFVDPAEPVATSDLPAETFTVTGSKILGEEPQHTIDGPKPFRDNEITFSVKETKVEGKFLLKGFEDTARVFVPAGQ